MAQKFYVVWNGRKTGIFTDWNYTRTLIDKFPKAQYKSFKTKAEAESAFAAGASQSIQRASSNTANISSSTTVANKKSTKKIPDLKDAEITIYTDGGCEPNPGKAGSGVAVYQGQQLETLWYGLYNSNGTNNSAELNALNQALILAEQGLNQGKTVQICSDSQYSINCITNWAYGWKAKGWKRQKPGDIKNLDIIQQAHELYDQLKDQLIIAHVPAHVGIEGNELADRMSIYTIDKKEPNFIQYPQPFDLDSILKLRQG
ncbi:ribonuclease H family protein [Vibrio sp. SS-MA-C1-2]|uniref:ribonuclease H family protein n=1 Tax=Vibrio sp. SS-MA-C1-2 TaxID=2908646 RepID=UPI001F3A7DBB|nr:ribonuclease H family protein [Vibrio sp. SS-MA-C1-2]UJF18727.1 ribonuclease H family protein [Vibrio sp. SS-MA-C1-2]